MSQLLQEKFKKLDKISDGFNKKIGKTVLGRLSKNEDLKKKLQISFIPTPSLNVNEAMGGGIPIGRTTIISGISDSGKTFLLLETIGYNMKINPNFVVGWLESEKSLSEKDLDLFGIDKERFLYMEIDKTGAAEQAMDLVESVIGTGSVDMFVVNSLKCLVPSEEFKKNMGEATVGLQARFNAKMMRKLTTTIAETETAFILIQHLTTQIGSMSRDPLTLAGGVAIKHGASIIVDMRKKSISDSDPIKKEEGLKVGFNIRKNHVVTNRFPYVKTEYFAIFGQGIEKYLEALDIAIENGIINQSGAWLSMIDPNTGEVALDKNANPLKWNGKSKFRVYCIENPDFFTSLQGRLSGKIEDIEGEELEEIKKQEEKDKEEEAALDEEAILDEEDVIEKSKSKSKGKK